MVSCAACGYSITPKNKHSGVTFHSFPKDGNRRLIWISFVKKPGFIPNKRSLLCSRHFTQDCFDRSYKTVVRLFSHAFPTLEVDRLKYVRSFNEEIIRDSTTGDILPGSTTEIKISSPTSKIRILDEEQPRQKNLKRKISQLEKINKLQKINIRTLQKTIWRQKNEISSLKKKMTDLKNENSILEEHCDMMLDHFENNKEHF